MDELDRDLVGLVPVKQRIRDIAALLVIDKLRMNLGLQSQAPSMHMCFTGNPGTGKTTVAMRMAEILLQVMENQRDDLVVILAGYKERMDTFFQSNPGMSSRIAHHLEFPDYSVDELLQIAELMLDEQNYRFGEGTRAVMRDYLERRITQPRFSNARSVRNALDRARLRQASRLFRDRHRELTKEDLSSLAPEDLLASRIFEQQEAAGK
ncbi:MAG: hypothetical protein P8Z31_08490 [Gammaproteobacteria bacterium]